DPLLLARPPSRPPPPSARSRAMPRRRNRTGRFLSAGVLATGLAVGGYFEGRPLYHWAFPVKDNQDLLTARVERGDMEVPVIDRGDIEAVNSIQVNCELEGGGKITSIVPEGSHVKKGDECAQLDTDALLKLKREQEVKVEQAESKLKASKSDLDVQTNKGATEVANAQLAYDLAKIDFDTYLTAKYKLAYDPKKGQPYL